MQRAKLKMQTEVEFIKFEKGFLIEAGDFLVIGDGGQEVFSPTDFSRRYELEPEMEPEPEMPSPAVVPSLPEPAARPRRTKRRRHGDGRKSPKSMHRNFSPRPMEHSIHHHAAMEMLEVIKILYADQLEKMSPEELADASHLRGITLRQVLESGLMDKHLVNLQSSNQSAFAAQLGYRLMDHDLLIREKFYVITTIGRRSCWHFIPT